MASKGGECGERRCRCSKFDTERSTHHATIDNTPTYMYSHDMIEKLVFCRTGPYLTRRATIGRLEPPLGSNCLAEGGSFATPYEPPESRGLEVRLAPT